MTEVNEVTSTLKSHKYLIGMNGEYTDIPIEIVNMYFRGRYLYDDTDNNGHWDIDDGHNILSNLYSEYGIGCTHCINCTTLINPSSDEKDRALQDYSSRRGPGILYHKCDIHGYIFTSDSGGYGGGWDACIELNLKLDKNVDVMSKFQLF